MYELPEPEVNYVNGADQWGYDTYDHAFSAEKILEAFEAGRASRDAEVEGLKASYVCELDAVSNRNYELRKEVEALRAERDCAVTMLAEWCVAVDTGGSGWDCWDEHYKTAMYRLNPIRKLLDEAIDAARAAQEK